MAQLRRMYDQITEQEAEVLAIGPDSLEDFESYWQKHEIPFVGLADPEHTVLKRYGQEVNLFKLGRQPAQMLVDKSGTLRFVHYGHNMQEIPDTDEMIDLLKQLNEED